MALEFANCTVPDGGTNVSSTVAAGDGDGVSTEAVGVGVLISAGLLRFCSAAISSSFGLTTKKNTAAKAPPLNNRKTRTPAMISGTFDFFFATGGGNGVEGADGVEDAETHGSGCAAGTSTVVGAGGGGGGGGAAVTGGGGGGGGVGGAAGGFAMSEVFGLDSVGPVVGPVWRGSATVAG